MHRGSTYSYRHGSRWLAALSFTLLLASCTGGDGADRIGEQAGQLPVTLSLASPQELAAGLPARNAAFTPAALVLEGADYEDGLPRNRAARSGDLVVLSPNYAPGGPGSGLAYASWQFNVPDYAGPAHLHLSFAAAPANESELHILVANFASQRWERFDYIPGNFVDFGDLAPHIDGSGRVLVVLLMTGTEGASVSKLRLGDLLISGELLADPPAGIGEFEVSFDASQLSLNGATVENYKWDLDGDGSFELDTDLTPAAQASFSTIGEHAVAVRLRSSDGLSATASTTVRVIQNVWDITTIATRPAEDESSTANPRITVVDGRPAVAWLQYQVWDEELQLGDLNTIWVRKAADANATDWGSAVKAVDHELGPNYIGGFLQIDSGFLGICFATVGPPFNVHFVRDTDGSGTNWMDPVPVTGDLGHHQGLTMEMVGGEPLMIFIINNDAGDLIQGAHRAAADCLSWNVDVNMALAAPAGHLALADINGFGAIFGNSTAQTFHSRSISEQNTNWIVDGTGHNPGENYSARLIGSKMAVGYQLNNNEPTLIYTDDFTGSSGFTLTSFFTMECDSTSLAGSSLGYAGAFCFHETLSDVLFFTFVKDNPGGFLEFVDPVTVDDSGPVGHGCNMTICNGVPMIVYEDHSNYSIKLAVLR